MLSSALPAVAPAPGALSLFTVAVPAPAPPPWALPDLSVWWAPRDGTEIAGLGIAAAVSASGPDRFGEIERRGRELLARLEIAGREAPPITPRLWGGFAFAPGAAAAPPWSDFGDAWFALPRALYMRQGQRGWLSLVVDGGDRGARERASAELCRLLDQVVRAARPGGGDGGRGPAGDHDSRRVRESPEIVRLRQLDPGLWRERVEGIRQVIADGRCEKIVYARRTEVELARPIDETALLGRLDTRHPGCFRFGIRRGERLFAGASPERLVARRGAQVTTESLAGSIAGAGGAGQARALLASRKDRGEHDVVTRAVVRALAPLCGSLEAGSEPEVRALRDVLHLCTPVTGVLDRPVHVLELARVLHPTPAVGGEPTAPALGWIAEHEEAPRGWYSGPVGWFDASGDGELAVAIRSGLVAGARAYAWAGAGIVAASDPSAEYAETGLKQRALLDVLGARV